MLIVRKLWWSKDKKLAIFCAHMVDFRRPGHICDVCTSHYKDTAVLLKMLCVYISYEGLRSMLYQLQNEMVMLTGQVSNILCVCVCVCACVRVSVRRSVCICVMYVCLSLCLYVCVCKCICMHACMCIYMFAFVCVCLYICMCVHCTKSK